MAIVIYYLCIGGLLWALDTSTNRRRRWQLQKEYRTIGGLSALLWFSLW